MLVNGPATPVLGNGSALASSVALGPVLQEARIQVSQQHKTRVRLWVTDDPLLGRRVEFGHRIGVLGPLSEIVSRFTVGNVSSSTFYSEDNGYERIPHTTPPHHKIPIIEAADVPTNVFPSQVSTWLVSNDDDVQLSLALERSHGVASLAPGTIDVIQHRRALPFSGSGGTVVLDDTDRIFTQSWLSLGNRTASNRLRAENKLRLNRPIVLLFGKGAAAAAAPAAASPAAPAVPTVADGADAGVLPPGIHLQTVRATSARGDELILRLQHTFAKGEDGGLSVPQHVDTAALLRALLPSGTTAASTMETTLDGAQDVSVMAKRRRFPAEPAQDSNPPTAPATAAAEPDSTGSARGPTTVLPFQLRTFRGALASGGRQ